MENKKNHGGARENAGRKALLGETKVMRVPQLFEPAIKQLINHLKEQSKKGVPEVETDIFLRDLLGRQVDLSIKSKLRNLKT